LHCHERHNVQSRRSANKDQSWCCLAVNQLQSIMMNTPASLWRSGSPIGSSGVNQHRPPHERPARNVLCSHRQTYHSLLLIFYLYHYEQRHIPLLYKTASLQGAHKTIELCPGPTREERQFRNLTLSPFRHGFPTH
jgi:hypothetical protein